MFKQPVQDAGLTGRPSFTRKEQGTLVQKNSRQTTDQTKVVARRLSQCSKAKRFALNDAWTHITLLAPHQTG